jgi:hypothetical protein
MTRRRSTVSRTRRASPAFSSRSTTAATPGRELRQCAELPADPPGAFDYVDDLVSVRFRPAARRGSVIEDVLSVCQPRISMTAAASSSARDRRDAAVALNVLT